MKPYKSRMRPLCRLAAVFFCVMALAARVVAAQAENLEESIPEVSTLGKSFLSQNEGGEWFEAESSFFILHADCPQVLTQAFECGRFFWKNAGAYPGSFPSNVQARIFAVGNPLRWGASMEGVDGRCDALAAQVGHELFVRWQDNLPANSVRLAHELAHYRLQQEAGASLPVWLEEGLASYIGWELARAYSQSRGQTLFEQHPPLPREALLSLKQLSSFSEYPEDPAVARLMYRQSEVFIRQIALRVGKRGLRRFVEAVGRQGLSWEMALNRLFGYSSQDLAALEEEMCKAILAGREK